MRRYKGNTPCPGCKRSAAEAPRFALMELCSDCSKFLRRGRNQKDDAKEFAVVEWSRFVGDVYYSEFGEGGRSRPETQRRSNRIRYISDREADAGTSETVIRAFGGVFAALDRGECNTVARLTVSDSDRDRNYVPNRAAAALFELHEAIEGYARSLYAEGFRDGNNLIVGLAAGTHTIDDANDTTARAVEYGRKKARR